MPFCIGRVTVGSVALHSFERRQLQVAKLVEIKELGVGEKSKLIIHIEGLLLLLLHGLIVWRWDGIQILEVLREIGRSTPIVDGHFQGRMRPAPSRMSRFTESASLTVIGLCEIGIENVFPMSTGRYRRPQTGVWSRRRRDKVSHQVAMDS